MNTIIKVENLNKTFELSKSVKTHVLKNINIDIKKGEYVTIMGSSGSGKSTLLYCISGMDYMDEGSVIYDDNSIHNLPDKKMSQLRLEKMGFIFQHSHLLKDLTIIENIVLPGYMSNNNRNEVEKRAHSILEQLDINDIAQNKINEASGGQLQRVSIARSLINNPDIIFADEPTGALNTSATNDVLDIIQSINQEGKSILLVTHDARVASRSERILFMKDGYIKDQLQLGHYETDLDKRSRQEKVNNWLFECGF